MLVCPQCQFENPNTNKFCQKCGTSLTHKFCHECAAQVPVSDLKCYNCGAITGQIWWAIISAESSSEDGAQVPTVSEPTQSPLESEPSPINESAAAPEELSPESTSERSESNEMDEVPETIEETMGQSRSAVGAIALAQPAQNEMDEETLPLYASPELSEEETAAQTPDAAEPRMVESELETETSSQESAAEPEAEPEIAQMAEDMAAFEADRDSEMSTVDAEATPEAPISQETSFPTATGEYVDSQQRYQLIEDIHAGEMVNSEIEVKVLDRQPLQQSPLVGLSSGAVEKVYASDRSQSSAGTNPAWAMAIPAIAKAYLALNAQFYPTVPAIHDAWYAVDRLVVLLEDRSNLPELGEYLHHAVKDSSQILHWLQKMTQLWTALETWECRQSLLEPSNLRVDEDEVLCMRRLYADRPEFPPTLTHLGQQWQSLFREAVEEPGDRDDRTESTSVRQLMEELAGGEIESVDRVRSRLEAIASAIKLSNPSTPTQSQFSDDMNDNESNDTITMVMPTHLVSLEAAGLTDIGLQRTHNEDDFGIDTQMKRREGARTSSTETKGLYILCDGMGGHEGGEIASALAVDTLRQYFDTHWQNSLPSEERIRTGVLAANQAIYQRNQQEQRGGSGRMGTTLVLVLVQDTQVAVAHVGDSRLYRFTRSQDLQQMTVDHEVGQREIKRGVDPEIAYSRPDAYQLTQAIGPRNEDFVKPDVQFFNLEEDSLLILASDGLTDNDLLEAHWSARVEPLLNKEANLSQGVKELIDLANEYNGHDNITAIVIRALVEEE